ncbi:MAG: helix-turn-helix transcriptional regulator [Spirochaetes bacterium]|nr:helix-turn-helix transcriptional regulator [Spirochaetota bacterium]
MTDYEIELIDRFKDFRQMLGLTQKAFAEKLNIKRDIISSIESGKVGPSREVIKKMIDLFDLNTNWLFTGEGEVFRSNEKAPVKIETPEILQLKARISALEDKCKTYAVDLDNEKKSNENLEKEISDLRKELNDKLRSLVTLQSEMLKMKPT